MVENPEFEPEFYEEQIRFMEERYAKYFLKWKFSWNKYKRYVSDSLRGNQYFLWIYLCGFEKFLQEINDRPTRLVLYKDAKSRIARIMDDFYKTQDYVNSL